VTAERGMRGLLAKAGRHPALARTVWAHNALPNVQKRFRNVIRVLYPLLDVIFIFVGVTSVLVASNALQSFLLSWYQLIWAALLTGSSVLALWGVSFKRGHLEARGKIVMAFLFAIYIFALGVYGSSGSSGSAAAWISFGVMLVVFVIIVGRVLDIFNYEGEEEYNKESGSNVA
jgi:hypothetical protein